MFIVSLFLALIITAALEYYLFRTSLDFYIENVQQWLFPLSLIFSFAVVLYFGIKREYRKALLLFLLGFLIYDLINYVAEAILYGTKL